MLYGNSGGLGTSPTALYCLNITDGSLIWARTNQRIIFTAANGYIYVNENNGLMANITCLNPHTGATIWNYSSVLFSRLFVVENKIYLNSYTYNISSRKSDGSIFALDPFTGNISWNHTTDAQIEQATVNNGTVYSTYTHPGIGQEPDAGVFALNDSNGEKVWSYSHPDDSISFQAKPVISDGKVFISYTASNSGGLYVLNASNGDLIWNLTASSAVYSPLVYDDSCYVENNEGVIFRLNASSGNIIWSL